MVVFRRLGKFILISIYGGFILFCAPLSVWLLFYAQTWIGASVAIVGLITVILPATCFLWYRRKPHRRFWGWNSVILGSIMIGIMSIILLNTPRGRTPPDSPVSHRFTKAVAFQPYTLANIIPEAEQINLGFLVMPYLDPILTPEQARRASSFTTELYREMESDRNFHQLGSVMGWAYAELVGRPFDVGHYYLYIPRNRADGPLPAMVFLHGSAGNFKPYLWLWSKLAEEQGIVIIAPSFGFGNWRQSGGTTSVLQALDDAAKMVEIDQTQVYLAGLSNGGLGVSQLAEESPERFRGLIFISPVMATEIVDKAAFSDLWRGRPVLVVTGQADQRVPISYVRQRVSILKAGGVEVADVTYSGEDHFLFFSQSENVLNDVANWLSEIHP